MPVTIKMENLNLCIGYDYKSGYCKICNSAMILPSPMQLENSQYNINMTTTIGKCGHAFHTDCLHNMPERVTACPTCAANWVVGDVQTNYLMFK